MSTIKRNKKGEFICWIPCCKDATMIQYTKDNVLITCQKCRCCADLSKALRAYVRVEAK